MPVPSAPELTVLVIDDEPHIRRVVHNALVSGAIEGRDGGGLASRLVVHVVEAATGREGVDLAAARAPGLVVLDLGLPDLQGIDVCREIRRWSAAPILVLSARHADTEKAALLDAGADDYMTKPFSTVELLARVRAQLRRARVADPADDDDASVVRFGGIMVDLRRRRVERDGTLLRVTPTEWALLRTLVTNPRRTLSHQQLFHAVWGNTQGDAQQYLRVYVGHLRRKVEADPVRPCHIQTEPGVGYRFEPDGIRPA